MNEVTKELTDIKDMLGGALQDARQFDAGNDAAGTRVRKACHAARARLLGLRETVSGIRHKRAQA